MKETKFTRCYIDGKKSAVVALSDGRAAILFYGQTLGASDADAVEFFTASGFHSFKSARWIPSADAVGVRSVLGDEITVAWAGSAEYDAIVAAAPKRPGGGNYGGCSSASKDTARGSSATVATAPAVVASSAFVVPSVESVPALASCLQALPVLVDQVNEYAAAVGASVVSAGELPAVPEMVVSAGAFSPSLLPSLDAYRMTIENAGRAWLEEKRREEEKRAAEVAAAEAAKRAAENGKQLVKLADGSTVEVDGVPHKEFNRVALLAKFGQHVYLHGPAGTGKTTLCKQVAAALGREFYSVAKVADEYQLSGFCDAHGDFVETEVFRAVKNGGVLLVDEADASDPNALTWLNSGLANGFFTFPGVGRVEAAPGFLCIMTGNTIGRGASADYVGRNPLDLATLDRFAFVAVGYDEKIELQLAGGDKDLVNFIHEVRRACSQSGVQCLATPRAIEGIAKLKNMMTASDLLNMFLLKGLEKDQINILSAECRGCGAWFDALRELAA